MPVLRHRTSEGDGMIADRKDVTATLAKRHSEATGRLLPMARILAGAAPVMDKLTRTEEWTRYCTYLQGVSEQFAARKKVALEKLGDPAVDDQQSKKLRLDIFVADATMDILKFAVELPAAILQGGEEADKFIQSFEKKNEATNESQS